MDNPLTGSMDLGLTANAPVGGCDDTVREPASAIAKTTDAVRGRLFHKYILLMMGLVSAALILNAGIDLLFTYQTAEAEIGQLQREKAEAAARRIALFFSEIETEIGWTTYARWSSGTAEQRRFDYVRLLRQVPAIMEVSELDAEGKEQLKVSRLAIDVLNSMTDFSKEPRFTEAQPHKPWFGPVYFRDESEPYLTMAIARAGRDAGVTVAEVNLKLIWTVINSVKVGETGYAYVVDRAGHLIAHPNIGLVLQNADFSRLPYVASGLRNIAAGNNTPEFATAQTNFQGRRVMTAQAALPELGWLAFVELPMDEALAPIYSSALRSFLVLLVGLILAALAALFLVRRMVGPIRSLQAGAVRIGAGDLDCRITVRTGDELETLAEQFNAMANQLRDYNAGLERTVATRTRELRTANIKLMEAQVDLESRTAALVKLKEEMRLNAERQNREKSKFLSDAVHDLRNSMHPMGMSLYLASLALAANDEQSCTKYMNDAREILRLNSTSLNEILDISRLESGFVKAEYSVFDVRVLLNEIVEKFRSLARQHKVRIRTQRHQGAPIMVRSDRHLLERVLANLVSNAIKYSDQAKSPRAAVLIGAVGFQNRVRIEIVDNGIGIAQRHWDRIFKPFIQLDNPDRDHSKGLGLGLSIVSAIISILAEHRIQMSSNVERGTRFSIELPRSYAILPNPEVKTGISLEAPARLTGSFVIYVEDDTKTREMTAALFSSHKINHRIVSSFAELARSLHDMERIPNVVITDHRLTNDYTAGDVISLVNKEWNSSVPTIVLTGEASDLTNEPWIRPSVKVMRKPLPAESLLQEISNLLRDPD